MIEFHAQQGLSFVLPFLISLGCGLLIGLERERHMHTRAGLRTFAFVAILGSICTLLSLELKNMWIVPSGLLSVSFFIAIAYFNENSFLTKLLIKQKNLKLEHSESSINNNKNLDSNNYDDIIYKNLDKIDPGTTTEATLLITYCLGALIVMGYTTLAVMIALIVTILLYFKTELSGIAQNLSRKDLTSILQFGVLSFIILPILPNHTFGPYNAINPHQVWIMVVLISGINLAGYIALRLVGERYGAPLLGIFGGLVSSTATTLIYSRNGKSENLNTVQLSQVIILLANLVVMVRLAGLVSVMGDQKLLITSMPVFGLSFLFGLGSVIWSWKTLQANQTVTPIEVRNPTEIKTAITFGLIYAVVLLCSAWLSDIAGNSGLYTVALISGLTDVDAITLSSLRLYEMGNLSPQQVITAIALALMSNMVFKFGLIIVIGGKTLAKYCAIGMGLITLGTIIGLFSL